MPHGTLHCWRRLMKTWVGSTPCELQASTSSSHPYVMSLLARAASLHYLVCLSSAHPVFHPPELSAWCSVLEFAPWCRLAWACAAGTPGVLCACFPSVRWSSFWLKVELVSDYSLTSTADHWQTCLKHEQWLISCPSNLCVKHEGMRQTGEPVSSGNVSMHNSFCQGHAQKPITQQARLTNHCSVSVGSTNWANGLIVYTIAWIYLWRIMLWFKKPLD